MWILCKFHNLFSSKLESTEPQDQGNMCPLIRDKFFPKCKVIHEWKSKWSGNGNSLCCTKGSPNHWEKLIWLLIKRKENWIFIVEYLWDFRPYLGPEGWFCITKLNLLGLSSDCWLPVTTVSSCLCFWVAEQLPSNFKVLELSPPRMCFIY